MGHPPMRLSRVIIRRFKSIDELEIQIPEKDDSRQGSADFVSIVGENNVGKSTIMEAIHLACPGSTKPTLDHFPNRRLDHGPIEVELEFNRLTEADKKEHAIRAHVFVEDGLEKYRIKKVLLPTSPTALKRIGPLVHFSASSLESREIRWQIRSSMAMLSLLRDLITST